MTSRKKTRYNTIKKFIINKYNEIPAQLKLLYNFSQKQYGLTTIGSIGNKIAEHSKIIKKQLISLDKIIIWHPIERKSQFIKIKLRKDAIGKYLSDKDLTKPIYITEAIINSYIPEMKSADSLDAIYVVPLKQTEYQTIQKQIIEAKTRKNKLNRIVKLHKQLKNSTRRMKPYSYVQNPNNIPMHNSEPFYLISSGVGRIQALKEIADKLHIDFSNIFIELNILAVDLELCELFILLSNEYRLDSKFTPKRLQHDNYLLPTPYSCNNESIRNKNIKLIEQRIAKPFNNYKKVLVNDFDKL